MPTETMLQITLGLLNIIIIGLVGWGLKSTVDLGKKVTSLDVRINGMPMKVDKINDRLTTVEQQIRDLPCLKPTTNDCPP